MLDQWDHWYPDCPPVGYLLRTAFPKRWVRFHSLPESKRYPEDESEYAEVLRRHNTILGELARPGEQVVLLTTGYSETPVPVRSYPELSELIPDLVSWRTVAMHELEDDLSRPNYWHSFISEHTWRSGFFDPIVRLVANDCVANVLMIAPDCRWTLHPYDGGMDVILDTKESRDRLRAKHRAWLSAHPKGL